MTLYAMMSLLRMRSKIIELDAASLFDEGLMVGVMKGGKEAVVQYACTPIPIGKQPAT
jgi:hypothetical protein